MNYHLSQHGQDVGVFPLEELCRRRLAGELTGTEFVWGEGMDEWERLDAVLHPEMPGAVPAPPPIPKRKSNHLLALGITAGVLLILAVLVSAGIVAMRVLNRLRPVLRQASSRSGGDDGELALTLARKPIPSTTNTLMAADVLPRAREFRIRQYLEGYEKRGERNPS
jgi:hypothetical protein